MNLCGDERRQYLRDILSPEQREGISGICGGIEPLMLSVSFWECFQPWSVPERRICDNFIIAVVSGEEEVSVNGEKRILTPGAWISVPEFVPHSFGLAPGCQECSHYICHCLFCGGGFVNPFSCFSSHFHRFESPRGEFDTLRLITALGNHDHGNAMRIARWKLMEWIIREAAAGNYDPAGLQPADERIRKAAAFIEENFRSNISVRDIAASVSLGEVRLRTLFREATGMTPGAYLVRTRLLAAARLLARYDVNVAEAAERSGFTSPAYFSCAFRQKFHCTPCEFRSFIRKI